MSDCEGSDACGSEQPLDDKLKTTSFCRECQGHAEDGYCKECREESRIYSIRHYLEKDVQSAAKWYKKYENDWDLFEKDYPKMWKDFQNLTPNAILVYKSRYRKWLFSVAFKDVVEK